MDDLASLIEEQEKRRRQLLDSPMRELLDSQSAALRGLEAAVGQSSLYARARTAQTELAESLSQFGIVGAGSALQSALAIGLGASGGGLAGVLKGAGLARYVREMAAAGSVVEGALGKLGASTSFVGFGSQFASKAFGFVGLPDSSFGPWGHDPFSAVRELSAASNAIFGQLDFGTVGAGLHGPARPKRVLARATGRLAVAHANVLTALAAGAEADAEEALVTPVLSAYSHASAVRAISVPHQVPQRHEPLHRFEVVVVNDTVAFIEETLPKLHPALTAQYRGARERATLRGADWWSQGAASLRKLLKGVLHNAAPNERVLPWALDHRMELDQNGRPARATKLKWLSRFIKHEAHRKYIHAEMQSAIALIDVLDSTQHVDEFPDFENAYALFVLRVEMSVRHILTCWLLSEDPRSRG